MDYPDDFPPESRAAVAAERLRAARDFDAIRKNPPRTEHGFSHDWDADSESTFFASSSFSSGKPASWDVREFGKLIE